MSTLLPWTDRPTLTGSILNPALVGCVITWSTARYTREVEAGMPWELSYLVPPLVLHQQSREVLPNTIRTHLAAWAGSNPTTLVAFADRARRFRPHIQEGLRFAIRTRLLTVSDNAHLRAHIPAKAKVGTETELDEILRSAATLGGVLGRAGSSSNVFTILGVSP